MESRDIAFLCYILLSLHGSTWIYVNAGCGVTVAGELIAGAGGLGAEAGRVVAGAGGCGCWKSLIGAGTRELDAGAGGLGAGAGGLGAEAGGCGCWRLEFGNFAANGICIKIVRDQESRPVGPVGKSLEKNPYLQEFEKT